MKQVFYDGLNFFRTLSGRRIKNGWINYRSFKAALRSKSPFHPGMPVSISVEPTTSCNLRCPECPSGLRSFTRPTGMMEMATFQKIIHELKKDLAHLFLYFQGEPYLNPNFLETVRLARAQNIYTTTSTNAHFLTSQNASETVKSGLSRMIVSMDGTSQECYEKYRIGGRLTKVIDGIKNLVIAKRAQKKHTPYIILQFLLFRHNTHQLPEVKRLAKSLGVDRLEFKTAQVYDFEKGSELIPEEDGLSRYRLNGNNQFYLKNEMLNKCWKMWHSCVMTWDGNIVPCCFDKDAKYSMGNIRNQSFREIWNGEKYLEFRSNLFSDRKGIDICRNCTEGLKV
ncbi:MAG: SPASM domain-containing protein [Cytophagales bacterium]|nr:SPASM domain-containing protein [Cytophagales bacterium]